MLSCPKRSRTRFAQHHHSSFLCSKHNHDRHTKNKKNTKKGVIQVHESRKLQGQGQWSKPEQGLKRLTKAGQSDPLHFDIVGAHCIPRSTLTSCAKFLCDLLLVGVIQTLKQHAPNCGKHAMSNKQTNTKTNTFFAKRMSCLLFL